MSSAGASDTTSNRLIEHRRTRPPFGYADQMSPYDRLEDLRAVAKAFRAERLKGRSNMHGYQAALAVYRGRHPNLDDDHARPVVLELIGEASERYGAWLYGR